ncbi:hypothetical protein BDN72DRAFT_939826 [Pluteus cervinus]|uniref:Uncharacterized protein n=1 Tax=Pluteus cervinus TaxID=181527 RepID=A0ACD3A6R7_9AGAR|nr:hypothetical protein BDN72DRAFT_939826 [Pluteus cervinus]
MDTETTTKKCSKTRCKRTLPINDSHQSCEQCREADKLNTRARRARNKAAAAAPSVIPEKRVPNDENRVNNPPAKRQKVDGSCAGGNDGGTEFDVDGEDAGPFHWHEPDEMDADNHCSLKDLLDALCAEFKAGPHVAFHGICPITNDIVARERVQMTARDIWQLTGYRFTVKDHNTLKSGHTARFWCSQDEDRKKKPKPSQKPDVKHRDYVGMKRYHCQSHLSITYREKEGSYPYLVVNLGHHVKHVHYVDVAMPPEAMQTIKEQIYNAWREHSQTHWRRDDLQLPSARKLLLEFRDEVDIFEPTNIPEGVEILAWGMGPNTTMQASPTAIDQKKRMKALAAWARCIRDQYGIDPAFAHVDKDMAEIGCLKDVWKSKISLCWWHLRRAVRTRMAKNKLSTTPYNVERARGEFDFIDIAFVPPRTKVDIEDYEGGIPDDADVGYHTTPRE